MSHLKPQLAAALTGVSWIWAVTLLATRCHNPAAYTTQTPAPPLWGNLGLALPGLLFAACAGAILALGCARQVRETNRFWTPAVGWLTACCFVPCLDALRLAGLAIPATYAEPLIVAGLTGTAVGQMTTLFGVAPQSLGRRAGVPWLAVVWIMTATCAGWWYFQGQEAYDAYLLGYNDFGHFAWRIANTWSGRGFLLETPSLPRFWDHFNPGLVLLSPLWAVWPDARLFVLIQAVCLAIPCPIVYGIARRLKADGAAAAAWAVAYLAFPVIGQLNLNYSYGWHPVSVSLPLVFLVIWALLHDRRGLAIVAALLACSFQEDIVAILCFLALAMAWQSWRASRRRDDGTTLPPMLADRLPLWAWLASAVALAVMFAAIFKFSPSSQLQTDRFAVLGKNAREVLLSPIARPATFWGMVFRPRCIAFLLCLAVPLGFRPLARGWRVLMAAAIPLGVLLCWDHTAATSIAFQYVTGVVPILFFAALTGASLLAMTSSSRSATSGNATANIPSPNTFLKTGLVAMAAGLTASTVIGALPWSSPTLSDVVTQTYPQHGDSQVCPDRSIGSPGNAVLNLAVAQANDKGLAVLATGRIAPHLLAVRRLDTIGQACQRWKAFEEEAGPNRRPIELFDRIVADLEERFFQSREELQWVLDRAKEANFRTVQCENGILVLAKPTSTPESTPEEAAR